MGNWHTVEPCWATLCCPCKTIEYFTDIQSLSKRVCLLLANQQYEFNIYAVGPDGQRSLASSSVLESTGPRDDCNECSGNDPDCAPVSEKIAVPKSFALHANYPNPFNASTVIGFHLPVAEVAVIDVYNLLGQHIARPLETRMSAGRHQIEWDGRDWQGREVPSGVYIYQLTAGKLEAVKKMVVLR